MEDLEKQVEELKKTINDLKGKVTALEGRVPVQQNYVKSIIREISLSQCLHRQNFYQKNLGC